MKSTTGMHLGTEVADKWWRRSTSAGPLARGKGRLWTVEHSVWFRRHLTSDPIVIPRPLVENLEVGKRHSGRWAGGLPHIKVIWRRGGERLSSGFLAASTRARELAILETWRQEHAHSAKAET